MRMGKQAGEAVWIEIRHAYENTDETIKELCARFGVSKSALEGHQRKGRWISRRAKRSTRLRSTRTRLAETLERQAAALGRGETLDDKEARKLTALINNLGRMSSMENADRGRATKASLRTAVARSDKVEMRTKLIKRLEEFKRR